MIKNSDLPGRGIDGLDLIAIETVAVSAVAAGLASIPSDATGKVLALVLSVGGQPVRVHQVAGQTPTGATGLRINANVIIPWTISAAKADYASTNAQRFANFKVIRDADATADTTVDVAYLGYSGK